MIVRENRIRQRLAQGDVAIGATVQMGSPESVEIVGNAGFDFVWIDAEHGSMDIVMVAQLIRAADACGIASVVRTPDHNPSFISRTLDAGAHGILAPCVQSKAQAEALVRATRFAPAGTRGACPQTRATGHSADDWKAFTAKADRDTLVWALIEDPEGVANVAEIASVEGLDAILFGPFDLAQALGHHGDIKHPVVQGHLRTVEAAAKAAGVELISMAAWEPGGLERTRERGARIIVHGSDRGLLAAALRRNLEAVTSVLRAAGKAA